MADAGDGCELATAVTTPIAGIVGPHGETRWHLRASSLGETVQQLSRIWAGVAREAQLGEIAEPLRSQMRADPRLAADVETSDDLRIRTRTSVLTLVVVAPVPEVRERAMGAVAALASRHPSRAVILTLGDPDGPSTLESHIYAACQVAQRSTTEICTEEILIKVGGELAQHLAGTIAPLLIHDLPVVLWWPDDVPFGSHVFADLATECERLLVDSGSFRGDGLERLAGLALATRSGTVVHDIAWSRLLLWRELLAGLFDHPLLNPELRSIQAVRVDLARPGSIVRLTRAALFAGWMAAMLDWQVLRPMARSEDGIYRGALRSGRREIPIEFRPVGASVDGAVRAAGSLVRAELEAARGRSMLRVRVTRQSDHLLATADWNGAQVARRAARLDAFVEMPFRAVALDRTGHDRVFEAAVDRAVKLMGASVTDADANAPAEPAAAGPA
jgi:glucose-6-phosphate dehydrogenase assembly protein OpcA